MQTDADYDTALKIVLEGVAGPEKMATIDRLGKGRLTLAIERFAFRKAVRQETVREALDWIEFTGEGCVPR